jgi:phosphoribosylformylglycinamidine cyclo-ligase
MPTSYREAGVDIHAGDRFVDVITPMAESTFRPEVVGSLGGFSGLFALDPRRYREPLLVSGTDGVGTKLKLAFLLGRHQTVGIDLVAMCVNDVVVTGAEPLFFLDYFATGKLELQQGKDVLAGIVEGCRQAGCALLGGETAEMPGFYPAGEYDLAGFAVGVVEKAALLGGSRVRRGDVLLGLASSGVHSNGFSLVRRIVLAEGQPPLQEVPRGFSRSLGEELLSPTRIYVKPALELIRQVEIHGLAHITGSGLPGNVPRLLPPDLAAELNQGSWPVPPVFAYLQSAGGVTDSEMLDTFNLGLGMVAALPEPQVDRAVSILQSQGIPAWPVGAVVERREPGRDFVLRPARG